MKTTKHGIITAVALLLASAVHTFAIEGLTLSLQCSNAVLFWPSIPGQNYIVQYRPTLDPSTPWVTLTSSWPADPTTNITYFVHTNVVQNPNCDESGSGSFAMMAGRGQISVSEEPFNAPPPIPMVMPANGSGAAVPLALYPPGFDLSAFIIFDPSTSQWLSGSANVAGSVHLNGEQLDVPIPDGGGSGDGGTNVSAPDTGFYEVVQGGVRIANASMAALTNGVLSNSISIGFEAGNAVGTLQEVNVLVDGAAYRGASALIAPEITGGITVDTSFLENGDHTFQVQAGWMNTDASDPNSFMVHEISDPITLTVSNIIYYPNWVDSISELGVASYLAETTCTNASWQIDIYDVNSNLVKTLTGSATNGLIEAYWNLVDTNGVTRTNADTDPEFSSLITVGDPVRKKPPTQSVPFPYPAHAQWVIAYQDTFSYMVNSNMYYNAIYGMGSLGANAGGANTVTPTSPTNGQCFPIRYTNIHQALNFSWVRSDETALLNLLTNRNMRNFYYNGHGGPNSISIFLSTDKFAQALKRQPYRFVFLDACSTANGGLPGAFGINYSGPKELTDFQKDKTRPRAYLGYTSDILYCENGLFFDSSTGNTYPSRVPEEVSDFLTNFEFYWYFNYDLTSAIYNAINDTPYIGSGWQTWWQPKALRL